MNCVYRVYWHRARTAARSFFIPGGGKELRIGDLEYRIMSREKIEREALYQPHIVSAYKSVHVLIACYYPQNKGTVGTR